MRDILIIMPYLLLGGAERALCTMLGCLGDLQQHIDLHLCFRGGFGESWVPKSVNIVPLRTALQKQYRVAISYTEHDERALRLFLQVNAEKKIQWVHACNAKAQIYDWGSSTIDQFVCVSEAVRANFYRLFANVRDRTHVIYNFIDAEKIREQANAPVAPFPYTDAPVILTIGRLADEKGIDRAIVICRALKEAGLSFYWYVIGSGRQLPMLHEMIQENEIEDRFFLLGEKRNPYPYIKQADIIAVPSRREGCCVIVEEAKILHKPIISMDVFSIHEQLTSGVTGLVVANDEEAFTAGLKQLLTHPERLQAFSQALAPYTYDNQKSLDAVLALIMPATWGKACGGVSTHQGSFQ